MARIASLRATVSTQRILLPAHCRTDGERVNEQEADSQTVDRSAVRLDAESATAVLESAPDGLLLVDEMGIIRFANRTVQLLCGHEREAMIGRPVELLVPQASARAHADLRTRYIDNPTSRPMGTALELSMLRADGSEIPVEVGLAPLKLGGVGFVAVSIRDVTERRQADRERRRLLAQVAISEQYFRSAFEGAPVGMVVTEVHAGGARIVRRANEQFAAILDTEIGDLLDTDLRGRTHPDDVRADVEAVHHMADGRQIALRRDRRYLRSDGTFVWVNEQTVRMRNDGEPALTLSHVVDISAQKSQHEAEGRARRLESQVGLLVSHLLESGITNTTYDDIARAAAMLTDSIDAAVIIRDPDTKLDHLVGCHGLTATEFATAGGTPPAAMVEKVRLADRVVDVDPVEMVPTQYQERLGGLLGAPLRLGDQSSGILVVARRKGTTGFSPEARSTLDTFAVRMALALAAAQGRAAETRVRVLDDRERIARDLHDTVIQDLFAAGMRISAALPRVADAAASQRLNEVVDQIDATIKKVRAVVFDLHTQQPGRATLTQLVNECIGEAARALGFTPDVELNGELDSIAGRLHDHLLGVLREGLSNVARHAHASSAQVRVRVADGRLSVSIDDNGVGIATDTPAGSGTKNVTARATMFGGRAEIQPGESGTGTSLRWTVPVTG